MEEKNRPVEMISVCSTEGQILPVRFRFETAERSIRTVQISEVISSKEICYVGIEAIIYVCKATMEERERLLELKYTVRTHRWVLFRVIY